MTALITSCYSPVSDWSGSEEEEGRTELGYEEKDDIEEDKVKHVCSSSCWSLRPPGVLINAHPNMFDTWPKFITRLAAQKERKLPRLHPLVLSYLYLHTPPVL
jgi:hypothetical protein